MKMKMQPFMLSGYFMLVLVCDISVSFSDGIVLKYSAYGLIWNMTFSLWTTGIGSG